MESQPQPSRASTGKRKFHNKSKTGCDNCKRRRVKCDEGKPACKKCQNMKLDCVYSPPKQRKRKAPVVKPEPHSDMRAASNSSSINMLESPKLLQQEQLTQQQATDRPLTRTLSGSANSNSNSTNNLAASLLGLASGGDAAGSSSGLLLPPLIAPGSNNNNNANQTQHIPSQESLALLNGGSADKFIAQGAFSPRVQSVAMQQTNSLGFLNSPNRSNTNQSGAPTARAPPVDLQSLLQQQLQGAGLPSGLPSGLNIEALSQLGKLNSGSLKSLLPGAAAAAAAAAAAGTQGLDALNMFAGGMGAGGLPFDFQELLGNKYSLSQFVGNNNNSANGNATASNTRASKANSAEEALAGMQEQQEQHANKLLEMKQILQQAKQANNIRVEDNLAKNANILSTLDSMNPLLKTSLENALHIEKATTQESLQSSPKGLDKTDTSHNDSPMTTSSNNSFGIGIGAKTSKLVEMSNSSDLNLVDLKLFHHYSTVVWETITNAGISGPEVWKTYIPELAFDYPFLMHTILAFSATHLSRTTPGLEDYVSEHRLNALKLLREAVLDISDENTDALVASALILIMDSLANASNSTEGNTSAWIFHVKGAVTILTAVWPLPPTSKFSNIISVDLSGVSNVVNKENGTISDLICFDESISDLYPVEIDSPYFVTLAYLDQLHREKNQLDFILRVFSFPALLDKTFLALLMTGDLDAMRIMRSYYKMLHNFTTEVKDKIWFLEGVSHVLPQDVDEYNGGGGMHMMLDFLGGGLPSMTTTNLSELM
ncbi:Ecm22 protein [Maudiozyma humilis]|uniref:Ecm22 protein n=1 Tax=Maudiozyma humilis TaxID=51915 RepID=A0AAV5S1W2_MAUHU|nr:Ecm22 protein [Kazachstania humilis]